MAIALRAAGDGASVAVVAKTDSPHPRLPGTVHSAAHAIREAGGSALALPTDLRAEAAVAEAVARTVQHFGGLDILVNNASAIHLAKTPDLETKRFDLMHAVNARGTFLCAKHAIPHLRRSSNPHILSLAPPLGLRPAWFERHAAYTASKYAMSLVTYGLAAELRGEGIACNCLWPRTLIKTAALAVVPGLDPDATRRPEIVADAAHAILCRPARETTGQFFLDEEVLRAEGQTDFSHYAVRPDREPVLDLFVDG